MEIKKCQSCGAPQSAGAVENCLFCGSEQFLSSDFDNTTKQFLLLKYEFQVRNFKTAARLANDFIKLDIDNTPAWGYKIVAESYQGDRLSIDRLANSLSSYLSLQLSTPIGAGVIERQLVDALIMAAGLNIIDSTQFSLEKLSSLAESHFPNILTPWMKGNFKKLVLEDDTFADWLDRDSLFEDAARLIVQHQTGSTSLLQRRMKLGYNRAGRLMDQLEIAGIVGSSRGSALRDVLIKTENELESYFSRISL